MTAIIYTGKNCGPCIATKHAMRSRSIPFEERFAQDHIDTLEDLRIKHDLGMALPYVVADGDVWSGFDLSRIGDLAARQVTA